MSHRGRRGRRRRPPMQWVTSSSCYGSAGNFVLTAVGTPVSGTLVGNTPAATFDPPVINRYTVQAVRGDLVLSNLTSTSPTIHVVRMGIIAETTPPGGGATAYDPSLATHADVPWLWLGTLTFLGSAGSLPSYGTWNKAHLNIQVKSKRVSREGIPLILWMVLVQGSTNVTIQPYLRTLISRVA